MVRNSRSRTFDNVRIDSGRPLSEMNKRILRSARANQCTNDLELPICQASVASAV